MDLQEMRAMAESELLKAEQGASEQIFRIRFQSSLGDQDGVKKLRQLKKQVARLKTLARERGHLSASKPPAAKREKVEV